MVATHDRSEYFEFLPPQSLVDRILCLWTHQIADGYEDYFHSVYPDGCVDIVWIGRAAPVVAGPATRCMVVGLPAGTSVFGVRFRPGWAACSLGLPANQMLNQDIQLADIWKLDTKPFAEQLLKDPFKADMLRDISVALAIQFTSSNNADQVVLLAIKWLARHPTGKIEDLVRLLGLSGRQLQRRFCAAVGYGPKIFQRIMRFQRLLAIASKRRNLIELAGSVGYADQAHMCREVRELAGESPQSLLGRTGTTLSMSDLFNTVEHN